MRCACGVRLRVEQTREPHTAVAGAWGSVAEGLVEEMALGDLVYVVRQRACERCHGRIGTVELPTAALHVICDRLAAAGTQRKAG